MTSSGTSTMLLHFRPLSKEIQRLRTTGSIATAADELLRWIDTPFAMYVVCHTVGPEIASVAELAEKLVYPAEPGRWLVRKHHGTSAEFGSSQTPSPILV